MQNKNQEDISSQEPLKAYEDPCLDALYKACKHHRETGHPIYASSEAVTKAAIAIGKEVAKNNKNNHTKSPHYL